MGTRNITAVRVGGKIKVAQYGQWDGYPTGAGQEIADFLKKVDLKKFKKQVANLKTYTKSAIEKAYTDAGWNGKDEYIPSNVSDAKNRAHPALDRDHGASILKLIHDGTVTKVQFCNDYNVKTGQVSPNTWCEYWYLIDLDKKTVSINGGKAFSFKQWTQKGFMKKLSEREDNPFT